MANGFRLGGMIGTSGLAALAAAGMVLSLPQIAGAQEPSPLIAPAVQPAPIQGKPGVAAPTKDIVADFHVESTVLGFERGIGPAVGRAVTYSGKLYTVADVFTADGAPSFSGGSHFAIAPAGGRLVIGLKMADPDSFSIASLK